MSVNIQLEWTPNPSTLKYVVDRKGQVVASLPSKVEPNDKELIQRIEKLLDAS